MTSLVVKQRSTEYFDDQNVASDFYDALDGEVGELLEEAAQRATDNDRKTVQPKDL